MKLLFSIHLTENLSFVKMCFATIEWDFKNFIGEMKGVKSTLVVLASEERSEEEDKLWRLTRGCKK